MKEIDRILFISLHRDTKHSNHFYILNDNNYIDDFYADNDTDAREIFYELYK